MGQLWKARDTRLDRIVAIKIAYERFSERFERGARIDLKRDATWEEVVLAG